MTNSLFPKNKISRSMLFNCNKRLHGNKWDLIAAEVKHHFVPCEHKKDSYHSNIRCVLCPRIVSFAFMFVVDIVCDSIIFDSLAPKGSSVIRGNLDTLSLKRQ